jgi:two-component system, cell cycle sensor histidine kinase and response regulator CckA
VLEAESGEDALEICQQKQGKIDLVITDLVMPGIGGQELARQLGEQYPNVRVLFTSGYTEGTVAQLEMLQEGSSFLPKPYSVADLSSAIHRILALRSLRKDGNHANVAPATPA